MKLKVQLFVAGKVFDEIVYARNYDDAKKTALARYPTATVIGVTGVFTLRGVLEFSSFVAILGEITIRYDYC